MYLGLEYEYKSTGALARKRGEKTKNTTILSTGKHVSKIAFILPVLPQIVRCLL